MTSAAPAPHPAVALVPGELRGYRQFELRDDGLYPLVHSRAGPWSGTVEAARCLAGADHPAPDGDCSCGVYGYYRPGADGMVLVGPATAVIAARGRCVLGDRGFRAAGARIEAVALPLATRWSPRAAVRARRMLRQRYPDARVYRSVRRMVEDHPPHDVHALGIDPPRDRSHGYRTAALTTYLTGMLLTLALATVPLVVAHGPARWGLLFLFGFVLVWQAALVWLLARLVGLPRGAG